MENGFQIKYSYPFSYAGITQIRFIGFSLSPIPTVSGRNTPNGDQKLVNDVKELTTRYGNPQSMSSGNRLQGFKALDACCKSA